MRTSDRMSYGYYLLGLSIGFLLFWLFTCAHADPATHRLPDMQRKMQVWQGDQTSGFVVPTSGNCLPAVPASSLTLAAFACEGYTRDTTTGELLWTGQVAHTVGPFNGGNGLYWVGLSRDNSTAYSGWTRQAGTAYVWQKATAIPAQPSGVLIVIQVTVASGAITAVERIAPLSPTGAALVRVFVNQQATGGDGSAARPWTGWDTRITWGRKTYEFPCGIYGYSTAPNWSIPGIRLEGSACTTLKYTGSGNAVIFDGSGAGQGNFDVAMENFTINGSGTALIGLFVNSTHHSIFRQLRIKNVTTDVVRCEFCVLNEFDHVVYSVNEMTMLSVPVNGIVLTSRPSDAQRSSANTLTVPMIEGVSNRGIHIENAYHTDIYGGTAEGNGAYGLYLGTLSANTSVHGGDYEVNTTADIGVEGLAQSLFGVYGGTLTQFLSGNGHSVHGGYYTNITVAAATQVAFAGSTSINNPSGAGLYLASFDRHYVTGTNTYHTVSPFLGAGTILGNQLKIGVIEADQTIAAAAFTDLSIVIPAFASVLVATFKVTTAIPTAASFIVVDQDTGFQLVEPIATTVGAVNLGMKTGFLNATVAGTRVFRLTPNLTPATATGVVHTTVYYLRTTTP